MTAMPGSLSTPALSVSMICFPVKNLLSTRHPPSIPEIVTFPSLSFTNCRAVCGQCWKFEGGVRAKVESSSFTPCFSFTLIPLIMISWVPVLLLHLKRPGALAHSDAYCATVRGTTRAPQGAWSGWHRPGSVRCAPAAIARASCRASAIGPLCGPS